MSKISKFGKVRLGKIRNKWDACRNRVNLLSRRQESRSPDMVFVWIPKTAGSSVFNFLKREIGIQKLKSGDQLHYFTNHGAVTFGHLNYLSLLQLGIVSGEFHNRAFKFSFVRNPYSRVASLYNYLVQRNLVDDQCFDEFLDAIQLRPPVGLYNRIGLSQTNPQTDWLMGDAGQFVVDKVFKVEEMDAFVNYFQQEYSLTFNKGEQFNVSARVITVDEIVENPERTQRVNEIYKRDFDLLGYERVIYT